MAGASVCLAGDSFLESVAQGQQELPAESEKLYPKVVLPAMERSGMSADEQFHELRLMKGRPLPESPTKVARLYAGRCSDRMKGTAMAQAKQAKTWEDAEAVRRLFHRDCVLAGLLADVQQIDPADMAQALRDLDRKFPDRALGGKFGAVLKQVPSRKAEAMEKIAASAEDAEAVAEALLADSRKMMLANPLLDDMELLAVRRGIGVMNLRDHAVSIKYNGRPGAFRNTGTALGAPTLSTHSILTTLQQSGDFEWDCDLVRLSDLRGEVKIDSLYEPDDEKTLITNARPHWDGERVILTMGTRDKPLALFEFDATTGKAKKLSPESKDHFIDPCYMPDGNIVVMSTAIMTALPCEGGSHMLSNVYMLNPDNGDLRQLGVDQDNSYHATVQADGRVMYVRYEYTDAAHYFSRVVMNMNPDGSNQREIYGSNSIWPTAIFYPQQVPGSPDLFSAVVAGHHGPSHMGRLVLFDTERGRREAEGAVQFIGKKDEPVEAVVVDQLYASDYPKFMYSVPLDAEYYLSMMKPGPHDAWGLYLVDRFDNQTLIHEPKEDFLAWPQVFRKQTVPPVIPSRIDPESETSTVFVQDIYEGPGLDGVPRGSVKEMAVYSFHYGYVSAASHNYVGIEGPWDARYILGTVPVEEDGSMMFKVPALMPISLMPLDEDGAALQKMRSWINPQPGEILSCVGCHETAENAPSSQPTMALTKSPAKLEPWLGEQRPYSFVLEMQPVLDRFCVSCHDGGEAMDLRNSFSEEELLHSKKYSKSYTTLQKYVRRAGPEGDRQLMEPTEWHASSSKVVQMLKKGHHGVELDDEAWRRLYMWIDLNVPFHAAFHPGEFNEYGDQVRWRVEGLKKYAGLDWNPEEDYRRMIEDYVKRPAPKPVAPAAVKRSEVLELDGWPFDEKQARRMQRDAAAGETMALEFGEAGRQIRSYTNHRLITSMRDQKERIEFVRIPAGRFVMGSVNGYPNETQRIVAIAKPFWMSATEVTNAQMQAFDPQHDSRFADLPEKDQAFRGVPLYLEDQPAVRVSHAKATAFCDWLGRETGKRVALPTEEQWEWAARAGTASDTWYGDRDTDFGKVANLSDIFHRTKNQFSRRNVPEYFEFVESVNDGHSVTAPVKSFRPNAWGLHDMIGNAEEWTASGEDGLRIVKGGSWFDVPGDATSSVRWAYDENIRLPDLGFRIIIND